MNRIPIRQIRIEGDVAYVPLTHGREAIIDVGDIPLIEGRNWRVLQIKNQPYAVSEIKRDGVVTTLRMHRHILDAPPGMDVDHADRDRLNNRRSNLRICTRGQNEANKLVRKDSATGMKGVFRHKNGRFRAKIVFNGKQIHIGYFESMDLANIAYFEKAKELFGEFARRN